MPHARLHHFERQFQAAIQTAVDAPRGVEVSQAVQAGILHLAVPGCLDSPAATMAGCSPRCRMLDRLSIPPLPVGRALARSVQGLLALTTLVVQKTHVAIAAAGREDHLLAKYAAKFRRLIQISRRRTAMTAASVMDAAWSFFCARRR